ncbi:TorD/DmsD family molecular chaperone [Natronococcus roseus]|uniref:TorD/DmsD family molecular chaperone n=1 Tax=Natronococcus roseus TaxID=1052014 RepID=UPI00374D6DF7
MTNNTIIRGPPSEQSAPEPDSEEAPSSADELPGTIDDAFHRSRCYSLLALGLERPGEEFDHAVEARAFREDLVESVTQLDEDLGEPARVLAEHVAPSDHLHSDWASLFGVEEGLSVSPYELTYLPGPLMTNVRQLADISGFYGAFGLSAADGANDRRDHICFELEFLGHLALREASLRDAGDDEGVGVVVDAQQQFLEDHLGRWYWRFADEVSKRNDDYYAALADLLAALVERELDRLEVDPNLVPDHPDVTEWNEGVFGDDVGRNCGGCGMNQEGINTGTDALDGMDLDPSGPSADSGADDGS